MTIRKMRQLLTAVEDQEMTIRQLRKILFDMEDQDQEAETSTMVMLGMNSYKVEFEGEESTHTLPASTSADAFFTSVAKIICFSDCSGEEVKDIRFHGKQYEYQGWQPGMKYEFEPLTGGESWVGYFPNWDH